MWDKTDCASNDNDDDDYDDGECSSDIATVGNPIVHIVPWCTGRYGSCVWKLRIAR